MTFEIILQLAVLACICVGVSGLVYPPIVFLPSRWAAAAILLFMLVPLGAAIEFYPAAGTDPAGGATLGFSICWLLIVGLVARLRSLLRRENDSPNSSPRMGLWSSIKNSWAEVQEAERQRIAKKRGNDPATDDFDQRIEKRRKEIAQRKSEAAARAQAASSAMSRTKYSPEPVAQGVGDNVLKFEYVDSDGVITVRTIRNWSNDGVYLRGWCEDRRATRTFRVDRVIDWL